MANNVEKNTILQCIQQANATWVEVQYYILEDHASKDQLSHKKTVTAASMAKKISLHLFTEARKFASCTTKFLQLQSDEKSNLYHLD